MNGQYFVGIGTMRCATSWMAGVLAQHPEVYFSPIKELHYFNQKYHKFTGSRLNRFKRMQKEFKSGTRAVELDKQERQKFSEALDKRLLMKSDEAYKKYFREAHEARAFGEITPGYTLLPEEGYKNIKALFPEARIIFGMRHPADRIWSHWSMLKRKKTLKKRDVKYFSDDKNILEFMTTPRVKKMTDYRATLDRIFSVFDNDSILFYFYEDVFSDELSTQTFLTGLFKFLSISEIQIPINNFSNMRLSSNRFEIPENLNQNIMEEYKTVVNGVKQRIGRTPDSWLE